MKRRDHHSLAYRPRPPFKIIEGIGTEPFRHLSPWAVWILAQFYSKFNGKNRANLSLTYSETESTMSSLVFTRSIWEIVGFGFLDVKRFGRLERNASVYALSDRWRSLDSPQKCAEIEATLEKIRILQRETGVVGKRGQLCALRNRLLGRGGQ